jgi:pimeloyl-ACP methyl ester carboxylesterase
VKQITREGTNLVYHDYGSTDDPTVLLLHGLGADHEMWQPQIDSYPEQGLRLIVPDLRGHGQSGSLQTNATEEWVEDLLTILAAERVERYALVGVSMGGIIAQALAIADRERLAALVLCDTFMDLETVRERLTGWATLTGLRGMKRLGRHRFAALMGSAYKDSPAAREYFERAAAGCDMDQVIHARRTINSIRHKPHLSEVEVPTLQVVGAKAGKFFMALNQKISDAMPNSSLAVLPDGTDPSNLVAPAQFDAEALPFLRNHLRFPS